MKKIFHVRIHYNNEDRVFYVGIPGFYPGTDGEYDTYGETPEQARKMAKECIEGLLANYSKNNKPIPTQDGIDTNNLEPIEIDETLSFVLWLRQQREHRGLSQKQFAKLLGTNVKNYQRLENPRHCNPTMRTLLQIRNSLDLEQIPI